VDSFTSDLNKVKRDSPEPEVLAYLVSLWRDARGEMPPRFLQNDSVLVELASTLAQERRSPAMDVEENELHELIRRGVRSGDEDVRQRAAMGLLIFADPTDIPTLERMTADPDDATFRTAVIAISNICGNEARVALDRIGPLLSKARAAFLADARRTYGC